MDFGDFLAEYFEAFIVCAFRDVVLPIWNLFGSDGLSIVEPDAEQ
jgi:hypothetical protein